MLLRPRGRPRAFDRDAALAIAAETFWRLGYEGASIADLTEAMGITPQSLYAAFTSKADLYREALAWYQTENGSIAQILAEERSVVAAFELILMGAAQNFCRPDRPKGCMISTATLVCAVENRPVAQHVSALRVSTIESMKLQIQRAVAEGELRPDIEPDGLARFLGAIIQGMSIQALDGAGEAELSSIARIALAELSRHLTVDRATRGKTSAASKHRS